MADEPGAAPVVADVAENEPENIVEAAAVVAAPVVAAKPAISFIYDEQAAETTFGKLDKDGKPENLEAKYWDPDKKAIKADVLVTQDRWKGSKLGKKLELIGAPDKDYVVEMPKDSQFGIAQDDPALQGFLAIAKKHDVSQAFVSEVIAQVVGNIDKTSDTNLKAEFAKLGPDGKARIDRMNSYLAAHLTPAQTTVLLRSLNSAESFEVLEAVIKSSAAPNFLQPDASTLDSTPGKMTVAQWNELNFAMDEFGNRKRSVDPAYNKYVEDLRDEVFGDTRRDANGRVVNASGLR